MQNQEYEWESDLETSPVVRRNTSQQEIIRRVNERIAAKKTWFLKLAPVSIGLTAAVLLLAFVFSQKDQILALAGFKTHGAAHGQSGESAYSEAQSALLYKMRNTVDNFWNVKASFVEISKTDNITVEFQVREGEVPASYVKITRPNGETRENIYNSKFIMHKVNGVVQEVYPVAPQDNTVTYKNDLPIVQKDFAGLKTYNTRRDPAHSGVAETVIAPLQNAIGYLEDPAKWSIQSDEKLLGREVTVVSGNLPDRFKEKHQAEKFKYWVDKQTGMLLKKETYDSQGIVVDKLEVKAITFTVNFDDSLYHIPEELANQKVGEQSATMVDHAKKRFVVGDIELPEPVKKQFDEAKLNKSDETIIVKHGDNWYVLPKQGYVVDRILENGRRGVVILTHAAPGKGGTPGVAIGYDIDSLEVQQ